MLLWILLVVLYLTALFLLGLNTLRKGHTALFWFGIILPFLWIVGAYGAHGRGGCCGSPGRIAVARTHACRARWLPPPRRRGPAHGRRRS